jgi:membrane protein YdbS with pleckstrin-like domain
MTPVQAVGSSMSRGKDDAEQLLAGVGRYGVYDLLKQDPSALSRQTIALMDSLTLDVHPAFVAYVGRFLGGFLRFTLVAVLSVVTYGVFPLLALLVGYIRVKSTRIVLAKGRLQIEKGIFTKHLTNIDLWRVRNIDRHRPLLNRITGDATLVFLLNPEPISDKKHRGHRRQSERFREQIIEVTGLARGSDLDAVFQDLLNLTFLLKSSPLVKGIIQ